MPQSESVEECGLISMNAALIGGAIVSIFSTWWGFVLMLVSPILYLFNVGWLAWLRISQRETSSFALRLVMPIAFFWLVGLLFLSSVEQSYYFGLHVFQIWTGLFLVSVFFLNRCYYHSPSRQHRHRLAMFFLALKYISIPHYVHGKYNPPADIVPDSFCFFILD